MFSFVMVLNEMQYMYLEIEVEVEMSRSSYSIRTSGYFSYALLQKIFNYPKHKI